MSIRRTSNHVIAAALLAFLVSACAPVPWTMIEPEKRTVSNGAFQVTLPVGWMQANLLNRVYYAKRDARTVPIRVDRITLTRDGFPLQDMDFIRFDVSSALPHLNKPYAPSMLPSEAADMWIADLKQAGLSALKVRSNEPATIAGNAGFKLHVIHKNARGLQIERIVYGFGHASGFYILTYEAPSIHYFPENINTFINAVNSFRLTS